MSEDTIVWLCIGGFVILAVVIIILVNWLTARGKEETSGEPIK